MTASTRNHVLYIMRFLFSKSYTFIIAFVAHCVLLTCSYSSIKQISS